MTDGGGSDRGGGSVWERVDGQILFVLHLDGGGTYSAVVRAFDRLEHTVPAGWVMAAALARLVGAGLVETTSGDLSLTPAGEELAATAATAASAEWFAAALGHFAPIAVATDFSESRWNDAARLASRTWRDRVHQRSRVRSSGRHSQWPKDDE